MIFNIHVLLKELEMGVLQHILMMSPEEGQTMEVLKRTEWNLMKEAKLIPPINECPTPDLFFLTNVSVWNCRGSLKHSFQNHVKELVQNHNPTVVMEMRIGGEREREITNRLPFDGAIHTNTIGYAGRLWVLWDSNRVALSPLAKTEQEVHLEVKVAGYPHPSDPVQALLSPSE
ncbi:uncharacterized protein LOC126698647 [Quercus robur]|uniref:uncharacterized protein LOC126698647 n=1 Tax=Quercus robur TaxID=38942 RepID=UPI002161536C|nr:uncharacterized protein LOC126698647 [Quercus robur]